MSEQDEKRMYFIIIGCTIWLLICIAGFVFIFESYSLATMEQRALYFVFYLITTIIVAIAGAFISQNMYFGNEDE